MQRPNFTIRTRPSGAAATPTRTRRAVSRAVFALAIALGLPGGAVLTAPTHASAQTGAVTIAVLTAPKLAMPGDDVTIATSIHGCQSDDGVVDVYLTSSDSDATNAALMARAPMQTTLFRQHRAVLTMPDAYEGWYGARVWCGSFRPPQIPMTNTLFAVGAKPTKQRKIFGSTVRAGEDLQIEGDGCPGSAVEYDVSTTAGTFVSDGALPTRPDGTWSGLAHFDEKGTVGLSLVRTRCVVSNQYGDRVYLYYKSLNGIMVTAPTTTTTAATAAAAE